MAQRNPRQRTSAVLRRSQAVAQSGHTQPLRQRFLQPVPAAGCARYGGIDNTGCQLLILARDTMGPPPALPCSPAVQARARIVARWVDVFFARGDSAQTEGGSPAITQACCGTASA